MIIIVTGAPRSVLVGLGQPWWTRGRGTAGLVNGSALYLAEAEQVGKAQTQWAALQGGSALSTYRPGHFPPQVLGQQLKKAWEARWARRM